LVELSLNLSKRCLLCFGSRFDDEVKGKGEVGGETERLPHESLESVALMRLAIAARRGDSEAGGAFVRVAIQFYREVVAKKALALAGSA
jgi:hypothetical protein